MKKILYVIGGVIFLALSVWLLFHPLWAISKIDKPQSVVVEEAEAIELPTLESQLIEFLKSKGSPLADYVSEILAQPNWKRIIAISHIESSFCTRKIDFNCWGIGGDSRYRHYKNYSEAIIDANRVMETYKTKTYAQMDGVYVQPYSANWLRVTTKTDGELTAIEQRSRPIH